MQRRLPAAHDHLFKCEHPRCGKRFTRKDHLLRHAANHSEQTFYCLQCNRGFKRPDLLQRHRSRKVCEIKTEPRSSSLDNDNDGGEMQPASHPRDIMPAPTPLPQPNLEPYIPSPHIPSSSSRRDSTHLDTPLFETSYPGPSHVLAPPPKRLRVDYAPTPLTTASTASFPMTGHTDYFPPPNALPRRDSLAIPDFEVDPTQVYGVGIWIAAPWDPIQDPNHANLAPPFNEPAYQINTGGWSMPIQGRVQESAERSRSQDETPRVATIAAVLGLNRSYPEFEVDLPYMTETITLYWQHVAPSFPFIHRGTFDIDQAPPELLVMLVVAGSVHLADRPRRDYRKIVSRIRGVLVQDCGLDMPISTLQAFCLCHVYDTWYGTSESLFVAQCMWPIMVAHSRKKGIGVLDRPDPEDEMQEEAAWAVWAKDEERRRAAFCVLLMDTHISAFWNQHPSRQLSIFAHNIALPAPKAQWEAGTAAEWLAARRSVQPPQSPFKASSSASASNKRRSSFLPGLHPDFEVTQVADGYSSGVLSALAAEATLNFEMALEGSLGGMMMVLGLMAVGWDCRTRGGMGLKFKDGAKNWRSFVLNGVINLRRAWESNVMAKQTCHELRDMRDTFAICIISVLSDIPMLQVAAGATTVCGASIGRRQYTDAQVRLRIWAQSEYAWTCLWQSARYLRHALLADWGIYTPWAVYLTTLVHWSFALCLHPHPHPPRPPMANPEAVAISMLETILASPRKPETMDGVSDLILCVVEKLRVAGAGEHDGQDKRGDGHGYGNRYGDGCAREGEGEGEGDEEGEEFVGVARESAGLLSRLLGGDRGSLSAGWSEGRGSGVGSGSDLGNEDFGRGAGAGLSEGGTGGGMR